MDHDLSQLPSDGTGAHDVPPFWKCICSSPILSFLLEQSRAGPPIVGHGTFDPPVVFSHVAGLPALPPQPSTPVMEMFYLRVRKSLHSGIPERESWTKIFFT